MFFAYNEFDSLLGAAVGGFVGVCLDLGAAGIFGCSCLGLIIGVINFAKFFSYTPSNGGSYSYSGNNNSTSSSSWSPNQTSASANCSASASNQSVSFSMF